VKAVRQSVQRLQRSHIDLWTLFAVLSLMVLSLGVVYSASATYAQEKWGESGHLLGSHAVKVLAGFIAMLVFMHVDYHKFRRLTKPALITLAVLLVVTLALGGEVKGASRFLRLGGFGLQPSEFAKFALLFHLSLLAAEHKDRIRDFRTGFLPMLIWVGLITVLVLLQPNFSTGAMIFALSLVVLFAGRARLSHLALTVGGLLPLLLAYMLSAPYRMARIMAYLGHGAQGTGRGGGGMNYQVWQGIIGFGNGGLFGLGPGNSRQRDLFLPESYGDFVFSIVGEEYGLLGTVVFLGLFLLILLRGIRIARNARDEFGRCLALGITASVTLYALINAAVTLGMLPTTGLPMPFVSYGGSSMLASAIAVGVLLNISSQTDMNPRTDALPAGKALPAPAVGSVYS
jgi:cell division protein FtsW